MHEKTLELIHGMIETKRKEIEFAKKRIDELCKKPEPKEKLINDFHVQINEGEKKITGLENILHTEEHYESTS